MTNKKSPCAVSKSNDNKNDDLLQKLKTFQGQ